MALTLGLPVKIGGHGAWGAAMVAAGELEWVRAYCECDCLNLLALYARHALLAGRTDMEGHDVSVNSLRTCLEEQRARRTHLGAVVDQWRASTRAAPMHVSPARTSAAASPRWSAAAARRCVTWPE